MMTSVNYSLSKVAGQLKTGARLRKLTLASGILFLFLGAALAAQPRGDSTWPNTESIAILEEVATTSPQPLAVASSKNLSVMTRHESDPQILAIRVAVQKALDGPPASYSRIPTGVRLLSVEKKQNTITLDFSHELLNNGTGAALEDALHQILTEVGNLPGLSRTAYDDPGFQYVEFQILVNGVALEHFIDR